MENASTTLKMPVYKNMTREYKNMTREFKLGVGRILMVNKNDDFYNIAIIQMASEF